MKFILDDGSIVDKQGEYIHIPNVLVYCMLYTLQWMIQEVADFLDYMGRTNTSRYSYVFDIELYNIFGSEYIDKLLSWKKKVILSYISYIGTSTPWVLNTVHPWEIVLNKVLSLKDYY